LVAVALFATGPAQMNSTPTFAHDHSAHAPMIRLYGPDGVPQRGPHNEGTSTNWSGYALSTGTYTSATISWTVPKVTYISSYGSSNPNTFESSSSWVGIGGYSTGDLIQLGTEQYVESNGTTIYRPWYELLPASETILPGQYLVSPGDSMTASLSCTANCTANNSNTTWALSMTDQTKVWTWTGNFTYESCLCSAEWIQEAPTYGHAVALPNYGMTPFTALTVNGGSPNLSLSSNGILLEDAEGGYSQPCQAFNGNTVGNGNQFLVAYGITCPTILATHDFNDDGYSDILWRDTGGDLSLWLMNGSKVSTAGSLGKLVTTWSVVGQRDFNGDGEADIFWRDTSGDLAIWFMNGTTLSTTASLGNVPATWNVYGTADLNGDGRGDLLWHDSSGDVAIWYMNSGTVLGATSLGNVPTNWSIVGDDNTGNIYWQDTAGDRSIWHVSGGQVTKTVSLGNLPTNWVIAGLGDFNGDGVVDILWRDNNTGTAVIWFMTSSLTVGSSANLGALPTNTWSIAQIGDYNADGKSDIMWIDSSGDVALWFMNGGTVSSSASLGNVGTTWSAQMQNAE
jgi:hypothetical protein